MGLRLLPRAAADDDDDADKPNRGRSTANLQLVDVKGNVNVFHAIGCFLLSFCDFKSKEETEEKRRAQQVQELTEIACRRVRSPEIAREREAALSATWGDHGSWLASCTLPTASEAPFNVREFTVQPKNLAHTTSVLRRHGAAAVNAKGKKSLTDNGIGQDVCSISKLSSGWLAFTVMDGHGPCGHWPAARAAKTLPAFLTGEPCSRLLQEGDPQAAMAHAFERVQMDMRVQAVDDEIDLRFAGCTATCVLVDEAVSRLVVATLGDSRAILVDTQGTVVAETIDHTPQVWTERIRVEEAGGHISKEQYDDGTATWRVNLPGKDFPGLAMTRAFGDDLMQCLGVTAEPEVVEWLVEETHGEDPLLVVASDGIWEFLSPDAVADFVRLALAAGQSREEAAQNLVEAAQKKWLELEDLDSQVSRCACWRIRVESPSFEVLAQRCGDARANASSGRPSRKRRLQHDQLQLQTAEEGRRASLIQVRHARVEPVDIAKRGD